MSLIVWVAGGLVALLLDSSNPAVEHHWSQTSTAVLSMAFGAWAFLRSGGPRITAAGLYCLSMGVYVGFAGLWWEHHSGGVPDSLYLATLTGYWTTLAMYALWWRRDATPVRLHVDREPARWGVSAGILLSVAGFLFGLAHVGNVVQVSLGALAFLVAALALYSSRGTKVAGQLVVTALIVLGFWFFVFSGGGRLNLVALALVGVVLASMRTTTRNLKLLILAAAAPAVALLGWLEVHDTAAGHSLANQGQGSAGGLESVVNPLEYAAELIQASGHFAPGHGSTFVTSALFWIPRSLWSGKPDGFGTILSDLLRPEYRDSGNSLAALSFGEWFYNWGWLGVVAMVVMLGWAIARLDRLVLAVAAVESRRDLLRLVAVLLFVASIPTLAWVGTFTYVARVGQQLLPLLFLALPFATGRRSATRDDLNPRVRVRR